MLQSAPGHEAIHHLAPVAVLVVGIFGRKNWEEIIKFRNHLLFVWDGRELKRQGGRPIFLYYFRSRLRFRSSMLIWSGSFEFR